MNTCPPDGICKWGARFLGTSEADESRRPPPRASHSTDAASAFAEGRREAGSRPLSPVPWFCSASGSGTSWSQALVLLSFPLPSHHSLLHTASEGPQLAGPTPSPTTNLFPPKLTMPPEKGVPPPPLGNSEPVAVRDLSGPFPWSTEISGGHVPPVNVNSPMKSGYTHEVLGPEAKRVNKQRRARAGYQPRACCSGGSGGSRGSREAREPHRATRPSPPLRGLGPPVSATRKCRTFGGRGGPGRF